MYIYIYIYIYIYVHTHYIHEKRISRPTPSHKLSFCHIFKRCAHSAGPNLSVVCPEHERHVQLFAPTSVSGERFQLSCRFGTCQNINWSLFVSTQPPPIHMNSQREKPERTAELFHHSIALSYIVRARIRYYSQKKA